MFDIELTRLVLRKKEENLQTLQNSQSPNQDEIDNLNKEINYLKAIIIRYEIAKLLNLHTDQNYMSVNYLGIENEDINSFNLTPDKITEYNNLISQLPQEQLSKYKLRKQLSTLIGEENTQELKDKDYVGIEKTNPRLNKYNLSDNQIIEFNNLVDKINRSLDDTTKKVDITKETLKILEESINRLNVEDIDEYERLKATYMDTVDKILTHIQAESRNKIHATAANCKFAIDLREKYPELDIILNVNAAKQLLNIIINNNLDEEKYNAYLEYLCQNITKLYQDDNNKAEIESMLQNIDRNNISIRKDLLNKLPNIQNSRLEIQDNELGTVFKYLDRNYDSLDETTREKYFSMLDNKLGNDINNLNKINEINALMLSITNKSFGERLQKKYSSKDIVKFKHQHSTSNQELIREKINAIKNKIKEYESKKSNSGILSSHYDIRIKELEKEIQKLESINEHTSDNFILNSLDNRYNQKTDKIIEIRKEIAELERIKENINSQFHKRIIDKKIAIRNKKIKKLQESKVKIVGTQKKIMTPKLFVNRKKGLVSRHYESRSEVFTEYADGYRRVAEAERNLNGFFSGIKAAFYDFRASRYTSKAEFNREICDRLRNGNVTVNGRNTARINRNTLNMLRNNQNAQVATQTI